jgi:hypothetical protein
MSGVAQLQISLRAGGELVVDITPGSVKVTEDPVSQRLADICWEDADGAVSRLLYVDPGEIAGIAEHGSSG